jgi:hypothetical protein
MAQFPQGLTNVDARCHPGERRVLHQLKRCLGDDYLVWHDVPIGPRARQPDFVVLSPRQGLLLLEVKDWRRSTLASANRDSVELVTARGRATVANPLRQARDVALELVDVMRADPLLTHAHGPFAGKLLFPWGYGAVFSHLTPADVQGTDFAAVFPPHQVLLRDDLAEAVDPGTFQQRLWGLFTVSYPHTLTLPQRDRIRWHLFPELRLPRQGALDFDGSVAAAQATPPAPVLPDLLQVMDLQQEQVARTLGEGHRVIHGAAGSGKTMILICRAQQLALAARADAPVLVLCFNRALADRIAALLRARGVEEHLVLVRTFHAWCHDVVRSYQLAVPAGPGNQRDQRYFEHLAYTVERALETGFVPSGQYTALLVDEAHDFEEAWLRMAVQLVNSQTKSVLVLYDDAQSIYQGRRRRFSFASVGIEARGRTSILRMNYRNTAEVLAVAMQVAQSLLEGPAAAATPAAAADDTIPLVLPTTAGRRGPLPALMRADDAAAEARAVADRVAAALAGGRPAGDVAVLLRAKYLMRPIAAALAHRGVPVQAMNATAFRRFDWAADAVRLITMHSAKGLEFPLVIVAGLQALPMKDESLEDAVRLLYVAMTRATHELVLSAAGDSALVQRVRNALAAVAQQFAGEGA